MEGETVRLPLLDGETVEGMVNIVETEANGWRRIGGALSDRPGGTFTLAFDGRKARGLIRLEKDELGYEIAPERDGVTWNDGAAARGSALHWAAVISRNAITSICTGNECCRFRSIAAVPVHRQFCISISTAN
jgi:hypothetical protein